MENLPELSGYVASTLVLLTFVAKDMRLLRTVAIFSNLAFITYGTLEWLLPVLFLHMLLLPLNVVRLAEIVRGTHGRPNSNGWRCPCPSFARRRDSARPTSSTALVLSSSNTARTA
jgi:hypothetical protein